MRHATKIGALLLPLATAMAAAAETPSEFTPTPAQEKLFRENAPKFHHNFSLGKFEDNGQLVTENIDVDSNNVKLTGRQNFVDRLKRYSVAFPGLQLKDKIQLIDGNRAATLYYLQGVNSGPFGNSPPSNRKIEAASGEIFEFDQNGLMQKLITITELNRVAAQVKGAETITAWQPITKLPNGSASPEKRAALHAKVAAIHAAFNAGQADAAAQAFARDVRIDADGKPLSGPAAFIGTLAPLKAAFSDLKIEDEYILVDGDRAAVEYIMTGTQSGPFTTPEGKVIAPAGKAVRVRGINFYKFGAGERISEVVIVHNPDDFGTQLTAP